jgi:amino acid adenylation domain-containing protein/thioester reductase-like protein
MDKHFMELAPTTPIDALPPVTPDRSLRSSLNSPVVAAAVKAKSEVPPIRPVDRARLERLPLSVAQERLWFIHQLEPKGTAYNLPVAVMLHGELNISQLEEAFQMVITRHEILRTLFPSQEGQARQLIIDRLDDRLDFHLERVDVSHYATMEARDREARQLCEADAATPFDLARGPLLRGKVIKLAEQEHILMVNMHHIISDEWSLRVLIKEVNSIMEAFRQARLPELAPLPIQYADYSVWQRTRLEEGGELNRQLAYWQAKLAGIPESLDLATDYPRPSVQSFAGASCAFTLDAEVSGKLKSLAQRRGGTLFMILLAAFKVLLYRYTGQSDICVGSPIANRQSAETEGLIGMFVNTLVLRSQIEGEDTFAALLSQVKANCLEAYEHQEAPLEKVVELLQPQRSLAISPLFQVMVTLKSIELEPSLPRYPLDSRISKFDLTVAFTESPDGLVAGSIEYSTALYQPQTIESMGLHFTALCKAIAARPTARIRDLDFLSEAEKHRLLVDYNATEADYPRDQCIHELFAEQVALHPDRTAVFYGEQTLSYEELYDKSCDLALYLQSLGVKPDSVVGLCVERSLDMMVGIMGIVQAGGAYLPSDPTYPDDRLAYLLQDSQAAIVLTQEKFVNKIKYLLMPDAKVVVVDRQWPEIQRAVSALKAKSIGLRREVKSHNASYLIYTSGSTGKPKGVLVEHKALVNRLHWMQERYPLTENDIVLQKTPYGFDVSVWEFFWPVMAGATVVFAAPDGHKDVLYLEDLIHHARVTTLHFVPSMLHAFLENAKGECGSVRRIFSSGEALDRKSVDQYKTRFPSASLHNLYGPTEAAIDVTAYDCAQINHPFVPIGTPIANTQIYILDPGQHLQPAGVPGELHIAGDGLARGYLNRPDLTEEKFVANPFQPGMRMYKTGDLARWMDDGNIQYMGRIDTQVKIRGFRIELGEIEARLDEFPELQDSAVVAQGQDGNKQLIAFYRAVETQGDHLVQLPYEALRAHLLQTLPEYMVPAAFVSLSSIPLHSNGKVDRRALTRMEVTLASEQEYVAPRSAMERQLVQIWAEVLHLATEKIGVNDNFFALGGHSLLAVRLIGRMRQQGLQATLQDLFTAPTLAKFAAASEAAQSQPIVVAEKEPDLDLEVVLDPAIVLRTEGTLGEIKNALLTGATGFLGAFLLLELLVTTQATIYCLVRAASTEAALEKIKKRMTSFGIWDPAVSDRIVPVLGDLASPLLGLTAKMFVELARITDVIYHCGAAINFYFPYSWHKAANVFSTEELLRLASFGRSKSFHFVSTLSVTLAQERDGLRPIIADQDPLPEARSVSGGYPQSKWVAEKIVRIADARAIPVVTYRPGAIIGHSETGVTKVGDFISSFILGCLQLGCVPEAKVASEFSNEFYMVPVDYVSRSIIAMSRRQDLFGRVFNLTNPDGIHGQELLDGLLTFDPTLQKVSYETWRARLGGEPGNALARFLEHFPERLADEQERLMPPEFDCNETLSIVKAAGIDRPQLNERFLHAYFSYIAEHRALPTGAGVASVL